MHSSRSFENGSAQQCIRNRNYDINVFFLQKNGRSKMGLGGYDAEAIDARMTTKGSAYES